MGIESQMCEPESVDCRIAAGRTQTAGGVQNRAGFIDHTGRAALIAAIVPVVTGHAAKQNATAGA
jgi:hypothetical protein